MHVSRIVGNSAVEFFEAKLSHYSDWYKLKCPIAIFEHVSGAIRERDSRLSMSALQFV